MGLTTSSTGLGLSSAKKQKTQASPDQKRVAIAGNPNVGKSSLFNKLTGLNQHTGNWTGKTISNAWGFVQSGRYPYLFVDIPGTYSLFCFSPEEKIARDFLCFEDIDACIVVCDATCLERGLILLLQVMEIVPNVLLCVNLMDEAAKKHIRVDLALLEKRLGIPVVGTSAHSRGCRQTLLDALDDMFDRCREASRCGQGEGCPRCRLDRASCCRQEDVCSQCGLDCGSCCGQEDACSRCGLDRASCCGQEDACPSYGLDRVSCCRQEDACPSCGLDRVSCHSQAKEEEVEAVLQAEGEDDAVIALGRRAACLCQGVVSYEEPGTSLDRRIDAILTGKCLGYPLMIALLLLVFWITMVGANYPSQLLSSLFSHMEAALSLLAASLGIADPLKSLLLEGVFRTVSWVVSVMLPPMAIFFPLFTLLEDVGYLPRVAYNLDHPFRKCGSCGKQALTMAMGFGCNAAGVIGCRIIDSPRERLIAILTNSFVPCNGRFPTLTVMISLFLLGGASGGFLSACLLTGLILLGVLMTFLSSKLLSATVLKGVPSSFTLELPPYRKPQIGRVLLRSVLDRTLFLLSRAIVSAIPAGIVIWLLANCDPGGISLLTRCCRFLDPFGRLLGLDGTVLMAFLLGLPANEIVLPILLMAYSSQGSLSSLLGPDAMRALLAANGWTWSNALSLCLFSLMHCPCATTLFAIHKETGSLKWTLLAILLPFAAGCACCILLTALVRAWPG